VDDDRQICRKCGSIVKEVESAGESEPPVMPEITPRPNDRHATGNEPRPFAQPKPLAPGPSQRGVSGDDIWTCPKCASPVTHDFAVCWNCGTTPDGVEDPTFPTRDTWEDDDKPRHVPRIDLGRAASGLAAAGGQVCARNFRSSFDSWEQLSQQAANFATALGPQRLISISHSEDGNDGVIIVWYWD